MLGSLRSAGFDEKVDELIVVSDGKVPGVSEAFDEISLPGKFLEIEHKKAGPSGPFNAGQDIATKPFISFIDDDDSYVEGAFDIIREHIFDGLTVFQAIASNGVVVPPEPDPYNRFYTLTMVVARNRSARWLGHGGCDTRYGLEVLKNAELKRVKKIISRQHW